MSVRSQDAFNDNYIAELAYYSHRIATPAWKIDNAPTCGIDLTYVVGGKANYTIDGVDYILTKGDLIYIPKGSIRKASSFEDDPMDAHCINFSLHDEDGKEIGLPFPRVSKIGIDKDAISLINNMSSDYYKNERGSRMKIRGWMQFLLNRFIELIVYSKTENIDNRIDMVLQYINKNYADDLSIKSISQKFDLTQSYFGSLFTKHAGMSFRQYLMTIRLNASEYMLLSGEYSVSDVALACGFTDVFYFSRIFKKVKGVCPSSIIPPEPDMSRHFPGTHPGEMELWQLRK